MKIISKSILVFIIIGFFCGCIYPNENNISNFEEDKQPDIFVKNCYKDYHNMIRGERKLGEKDSRYENNDYLPYYVYEDGEDYYYALRNTIYKYSNNTSEELFTADVWVYALVGVYEENIYYTSQFSLWKYDIQNDVSEKVFDEDIAQFDTVFFENYLIIKDNKSYILYFYDIEKNQKIVIEDCLSKEQDEINQMLPEGFSVRKAKGSYAIEVYYDNGNDLVKIGLEENNINEKNEEEMLQDSGGLFRKINIIGDDLYVFFVSSQHEAQGHGPLVHYGTAERCKTKYWRLDRISKIHGPNLYDSSYHEEETIYEDSTNRIIGYNPYTNEVYLYVFENGTLTAKDLDDQSEKVIETLKEADTIQFEWHDTRLYWRYNIDGKDEFGGCHEFN